MIAIMRHIHLSQSASLDHRGRDGLARNWIRHRFRNLDLATIHLEPHFFRSGRRWHCLRGGTHGLDFQPDALARFPTSSDSRDGFCWEMVPLATNSSLNLPTKLWTGHAQASPKAQMVRPPGMLSAILIR